MKMKMKKIKTIYRRAAAIMNEILLLITEVLPLDNQPYVVIDLQTTPNATEVLNSYAAKGYRITSTTHTCVVMSREMSGKCPCPPPAPSAPQEGLQSKYQGYDVYIQYYNDKVLATLYYDPCNNTNTHIAYTLMLLQLELQEAETLPVYVTSKKNKCKHD